MKIKLYALVEMLFEMARLIVSSVIGFALTEGVIATLVNYYGVTIDPTIRIIVIGLVTSVIRGIDRYIHVDTSIDSKGFLPHQ